MTRFDWSSDAAGDRAFPRRATVLRPGWKCGGEVLVKPKLTRGESS